MTDLRDDDLLHIKLVHLVSELDDVAMYAIKLRRRDVALQIVEASCSVSGADYDLRRHTGEGHHDD